MCTVSVIIPYFNSESSITRALNSVINQTYKDYEIILIDDCSTDNSYSIAQEYICQNAHVKFRHYKLNSNKGPSYGRNIGIKNSKGKFIAFLDSDDSWEPNKLELQVKFMKENPQYKITGTNYNIVLPNKKLIKYKSDYNKIFIEGSFIKMFFKVFYCMPTVMVEKDMLVDSSIYFKERKNQAEDHLFYYEIMSIHKGARLGTPLANIFKLEYGQGGLTQNIDLLIFNELDNFKYLYKKRTISLGMLLIASITAYMKHIKRKVKTIIYESRGWDEKSNNL